MPEVEVLIGGRGFSVACQEGEEQFLHEAAGMLDREASALIEQVGRIPEPKMLLMAGLMLADRTVSAEDKLKSAQAEIAALQEEIAALRNAPAPEPEKVAVPYVPESVSEALAEVAARAEALAAQVEDKTGGSGSE